MRLVGHGIMLALRSKFSVRFSKESANIPFRACVEVIWISGDCLEVSGAALNLSTAVISSLN